MTRIVAILLLAIGLAACASTGDPVRDQQREVVRDLAVDVGTMRLMRAAPGLAEDVSRVSAAAISVLDRGDVATIGALRHLVEGEINFERLEPEEALLVQALIELVALEVQMVAPDGVLSPEARGRALFLLRRVNAMAMGRLEARG